MKVRMMTRRIAIMERFLGRFYDTTLSLDQGFLRTFLYIYDVTLALGASGPQKRELSCTDWDVSASNDALDPRPPLTTSKP